MDDMQLLEQRAQALAAEAEADKPKLKKDILFVRYALHLIWSYSHNYSTGGFERIFISLLKSAAFSLQMSENNLKPPWNHFNPFRTKTPKMYSQEEINLYCIIKLATFLYFHYKISKTWCFVYTMKYEHLAILSNLNCCQFAPKIVIFNLCICCQFEDLGIIFPKITSCEPSQHLIVTNEGSFFAVYFSLSFGT